MPRFYPQTYSELTQTQKLPKRTHEIILSKMLKKGWRPTSAWKTPGKWNDVRWKHPRTNEVMNEHKAMLVFNCSF